MKVNCPRGCEVEPCELCAPAPWWLMPAAFLSGVLLIAAVGLLVYVGLSWLLERN